MLRAFGAAATLLIGALLSGCASTILVDNDVQAFSSLPAAPIQATGYRFERLPSQQADAPRQARLEVIAQQALAQVGMRRDDADPAYSVQIDASVQRVDGPTWGGPWPGWGLSGRYVVNRRGQLVWLGGFGGYYGYPGFYDMPYFVRSVSLTMRDLHSHAVVYETHASNDGPWPNTDAVLPAMFEAALRGFPNPPPGPRRVDITIPR